MSACETCDYATENGWWGRNLSAKTHCSECHATWGGITKAHCKACHQTFATNGVADHHWTKTGHTHPSEIKAFWSDESGVWHYGPRYDPESLLALTERPLGPDPLATP